MVIPGDKIKVTLHHVGMIAGKKVINVEAVRSRDGEPVLKGEAEVEERPSGFVFTGQGSQEVGMGMELAKSSPAAMAVWDRADAYLETKFGFRISRIVKENPKELTIHFGGQKGREIRKNYIDMELKVPGELARRVFPDISRSTTSYTFRHHDGLLFATEFAQPALTVMCKARFADLLSRGLVPTEASFAGHSLGEYAALASMGDIMTVEELVAITWFRGLNMRLVVERDEQGRSPYAMVAINPSKVSSSFTESDLHAAVDAAKQGQLLEIVNHNIVNLQYVCAGTRSALKNLIDVLTVASTKGLNAAIERCSSLPAAASASDTQVKLERTKFAVPLSGVDVPFHSSFLRPGIDAYREVLLSSLHRDSIQPSKLVGRWIPNVTGRTFSVSRDEVEAVQRLTGSHVLEQMLSRSLRME